MDVPKLVKNLRSLASTEPLSMLHLQILIRAVHCNAHIRNRLGEK